GTLGKTGVVGSSETDNDNDYAFTVSGNNSSNKPGTLPNTATNTPTLIAIGASLLLVGGTVLLIRKRKLTNEYFIQYCQRKVMKNFSLPFAFSYLLKILFYGI